MRISLQLQRLVLTGLLAFLPLVFVSATHLRGGYIRAERVSKNSLEFLITLTVFTTLGNSSVPVGGVEDVTYLNFGDGTRMFVPQILPVVPPGMDATAGVGMAAFTFRHMYSGYGQFKISYAEPNRNAGVLNAGGTLTSLFYLETILNLDAQLDQTGSGFVSTPAPIMPPVFQAAIKSDFTASIASRGVEGFSHFYTLVAPLKEENTPLAGYLVPENFELNKFTGQITWDTKFKGSYAAGEYAFAAKIHQFKGEYKLCEVLVDFQLILTEEDVTQPSLTDNVALDDNNRIYLPVGTSRTIRVFAEDAASEAISLHVYSGLSDVPEYVSAGAVTFSEYDSTEGARNIRVGLLKLTCFSEMVRTSPFPVSVRAQFQRNGASVYGDLSYLVFTTDTELEYPDPVLATHDDEAGTPRAYPNPVEDFLYFDWAGVKSVRLYTMEGELILEEQAGAANTIDFRSRKPGIYFLQYERSDRKSGLIKLIKSK